MLTENRQVVADNHLKLCKFDKMFLNEGSPQYFHKINFLICCFQSVKDIKFESNSQLISISVGITIGCFRSVKDIKFESNSQHAVSVSEELP